MHVVITLFLPVFLRDFLLRPRVKQNHLWDDPGRHMDELSSYNQYIKFDIAAVISDPSVQLLRGKLAGDRFSLWTARLAIWVLLAHNNDNQSADSIALNEPVAPLCKGLLLWSMMEAGIGNIQTSSLCHS